MSPPPVSPRATRLTSRAAVLAVVICAIVLSLAYPVREFMAQRQQIDQLVAQKEIKNEVKEKEGKEGKKEKKKWKKLKRKKKEDIEKKSKRR